MTPKTQFLEGKKSDKLNFIQVKNFYSIKDTHCEENEKQPTDWGKLLASYTFDKGLASRIYIYFFNFFKLLAEIDMYILLYLFIH